MTFEEVLPALKAGSKVYRQCWWDCTPHYGKIYIYLTPDCYRTGTYPEGILLWFNDNNCFAAKDKSAIKAIHGDYFAVEWATATIDILADDFEVLDED